MRICHLLHQICQNKDEDFIKAVFGQLLHREPGKKDAADHMALLAKGLPRSEIIVGIMNSEEAVLLYTRPSDLSMRHPQTVADKLRRLLAMKPDDFVHHLYVEMLYRYPDPGGFSGFMKLLSEGHSRMSIITSFIRSPEFLTLLNSDRYFFTRKILANFFEEL